MRICFIYFLLIGVTLNALAQNPRAISLADFSLQNDSIPFKIEEIIDGRKDKNVIGIIQVGLNNRKELAVFEKPGLQEIEELMDRSGLKSNENGFVMRISKLYVSEKTRTWSETAKAELSVDFFVPLQNDYYYLSSVYATAEPKGIDVTSNHAANIVTVFQKTLSQFAARVNKIDESQSFTHEELINPENNFRDISSMPIVEAIVYKDGYFSSFDEFINNSPSIDIDCKIKPGTSPKVKCGGGKEESTNLYGFAKDNKLYVLFHQKFYQLEKTNDKFFFFGPREVTSKPVGEMAMGWIMAGSLGAMVVQSSGESHSKYMIDLSTGVIKNVSGL